MLYYRLSGEGKPTVLFDAGLGDTSEVWVEVASEIATLTSVVVYDRANLGKSSPTYQPRTSANMVGELRGMLHENGVESPYILVGHSFSGLNMMLFARLFPNEVAGLVLVDSAHPNQMAPLLALLTPDLAEEFKAGIEYVSEKMTFEARLQSEADVVSAPPMPDVPLVVLTRMLKRPSSDRWPTEALDALWNAHQQDLASLTTQSKLIIADQSGHYIQREQPQVVIEAITELIITTRKPQFTGGNRNGQPG